MEWLKDKKNLPIVAGLGVVVLLLALVAILFETGVIGGAPAPQVTTAPLAPAPPVAPGGPPMPGASPYGAPGVPGRPSAPGAPATPAATAVAAKPTVGLPPTDVAKGLDPFNAPRPKVAARPGFRPAKITARQVAPFVSIARLTPVGVGPATGLTQTPIPQILITPEESATMRVSGVVQTSTGVHAVLEANGQSLPVQPGDAVPGGRVVSIQSDGLVLRTTDNRTVHVPLGNVPSGGGGGGGYPGGGYPGGGYPGGYPGQGGGPDQPGGYNG